MIPLILNWAAPSGQSPEEAAAALKQHDQARIEQIRRDTFVGTGPEVAARIVELKDRVGVDEMAVVTWTHDEQVRRDSYTELAKAYGFAPEALVLSDHKTSS